MKYIKKISAFIFDFSKEAIKMILIGLWDFKFIIIGLLAFYYIFSTVANL